MQTHANFLAYIAANPTDPLCRSVYADWLEERGEADESEVQRILAAKVHPLKLIPETPGWRQWDDERSAREQQQEDKARRIKAAAAAQMAAVQAEVVAALYPELETEKGYWAGQFRRLLKSPGIIHVAHHDLRGTPPVGTCWVRKATSGKWGKSRQDKYGRPLTRAELEKMLEETPCRSYSRRRSTSGG